MGLQPVSLSNANPLAVAAAITSVLESDGVSDQPISRALAEGARATLEETDQSRSQYFQSILEVGYLVAAADGFDDLERHALAGLLERVTGKAVDHAALELHFKDLDDAVAMLGRHERLRRAAADFESGTSKREALSFATLIAMADGKLAAPELQALTELGGALELTSADIEATVQRTVERVKSALSS
jgi:tellurite resistance protein